MNTNKLSRLLYVLLFLVPLFNNSFAQIAFDALPDCDDALGSTGTLASNGTMYIHISNLTGATGTTTFSITNSNSNAAAVAPSNNSITSGTSGTILITGLTTNDYGTILTITGTDDGTEATATIKIPVTICGFLVDNGGAGNIEDDFTNGIFCTDQHGITAPGILVESAPTSALSSGNEIITTDVYVLTNTDNDNEIIAFNKVGLFSASDIMDNADYKVYSFKVENNDLTNFENAIALGTTDITAIINMTGDFSNFCYASCWNVSFSPDCSFCPTISALTATNPICSGTATTDLQATIGDFFNTENSDADYDVEFLYTTTKATTAAEVYNLTATIIGTFDITEAAITTATINSFTLPEVTASTTYYIYARIFDATTVVANSTCRPFQELQIIVHPTPVVEAGDAQAICSTGSVSLSSLNASITNTDNAQGTWTTSGTGTFDNAGDFQTATTYTPSTADIIAGTVTLIVTSTGASTPCTNSSDEIIITVSNVSCDATFPWSGNDDDD